MNEKISERVNDVMNDSVGQKAGNLTPGMTMDNLIRTKTGSLAKENELKWMMNENVPHYGDGDSTDGESHKDLT